MAVDIDQAWVLAVFFTAMRLGVVLLLAPFLSSLSGLVVVRVLLTLTLSALLVAGLGPHLPAMPQRIGAHCQICLIFEHFQTIDHRPYRAHKVMTDTADQESGKIEIVLPGYSVDSYSVSPDGKSVTFAMVYTKGHPSIWIARTDRRTSPTRISSSSSEDSPHFLPDGTIVFRALENGANFLYRMRPDGSDRQKLISDRILDLMGTSPDGRWITVIRPRSGESSVARSVISIDGQRSVDLCSTICGSDWDTSGNSMVFVFPQQSVVVPLVTNTGLPQIPSTGFSGPGDFKKITGAKFIDKEVQSMITSSVYAYQVDDIRRNLYRIPFP